GIVAEDLAVRGFAAIDDRDLREWLVQHGAQQLTVENAPFIRGLYDLVFAYQDGDTSRPDLAAGKAIQAIIRIACTYKGALLYRLNSGMDETVFQPLYQVLSDRNVQFRFLHTVTNLGVENGAVTTIELQPQVAIDDYGAYPVDMSAFAKSELDFERGDSDEGIEPLTLTHGDEENGFEHVVLAIAGGALKPVCGELDAASPAFHDMLENTKHVATQALQVWLTKPLSEIGWQHAPEAVLSAYYEPMATFAPMGHLRATESWPPGATAPADIGYFCGPLAEGAAPGPPMPLAGEQTQQVGMPAPEFEEREGAAALLSTPGGLDAILGRSFAAVLGAGKALAAFDWNVLYATKRASGDERFDQQFWRGNTAPSERYVTTFAGTPQFRLAPDASGFGNLALAGDWTRNGIDGGCMEAAVASGRLAARAISGRPAVVPGTTGWLADSGWAQQAAGAYVQYGGLTTIASPYRCDDATLHGFWARADPARLDRLCERVFSEPTGGRMRFEAVGSHVMITWGRIPTVSSLDPAFEGVGTVNEDQVAIWVPVLGPEGFAMFVAYIWLDNPMSLTTGREVLGYPKTWGELTFADDGKDGPFGLKAFGLRERGDRAGFSELLDVTITESPDALGARLESIHDLAWHAARELLPYDPAELLQTAAGGAELLTDVAQARMRSVFLKQIPAVEGSSGAALQQITETSYVIRRLQAWPLGHTYRLEVQPMFSHPLLDDLGLESQVIDLAYRCEMDFDVRDSRVLWPS
ncbi:MAG TPA: FAD-dependent oxidoreductase, partial [Solirubrobacteraceae bacterium]|nr:FAD-dependent oxidoreductase [Solirubrobacteraceae bacterium]